MHLLWIIKDLKINERTFFTTEKAFVRLHADAYISNDGSVYNFITAFDSVRVYSSMVDVTSSHGENIAAALQMLLIQTLNKAKRTAADSLMTMTAEQIIAKEKQRLQLHIITDTVYKEGAYLTFQEFLQNNPSIVNYEIVKNDKKKSKIVSLNKDSSRSELSPWGICKKGELYKYHENDLIPIEKNGYVLLYLIT